MSDISLLLDSTLIDEPDTAPDVQVILAAARRRQLRRRLTSAGSGLVLTAGLVGVAVAVAADGSSPSEVRAGATTSSLPPVAMGDLPHPNASALASAMAQGPSGGPGGPAVHGINRYNLADLIEKKAGVRLSGVQVQDLPPTWEINLAAAIASAQGQYLNVQVAPAGTSSTAVPTCADLSGSAPDGDGYSGPCTVTPTTGGGYLVVRSGRTADDRFAKTQADLVGRDGSSIMAETSNQTKQVGKRPAPAVTREPPLSMAQVRELVLGLNSYR